MKNNLHTELRRRFITLSQSLGSPWEIDSYEDIEEIADWWLSKFDEFQSATSPDSIVKQDTLESLIDECGHKFILRSYLKNYWTATNGEHSEAKSGTGKTPREAVEKLLKELKK